MNSKSFNLIIEINKDSDNLSLRDLVEFLNELMTKHNNLESLLDCKIKFLEKPPILNASEIIKNFNNISEDRKSLSINNSVKDEEIDGDLFENMKFE